jgi:hypothetical protein
MKKKTSDVVPIHTVNILTISNIREELWTVTELSTTKINYWTEESDQFLFQAMTNVYCFVDRFLSLFFWPFCCLSSFDLWILITPLVSSNSWLSLVDPSAYKCTFPIRLLNWFAFYVIDLSIIFDICFLFWMFWISKQCYLQIQTCNYREAFDVRKM